MAIYFAVEAGAMNEAWFWAIAIMVISLSGIIGVNFWQELREKKRGAGSRLAVSVAEREQGAKGRVQMGIRPHLLRQLPASGKTLTF
jgi:molybdate transport system permease protein